jgi:cyanuric acid amidohydrolase
MQKVTVFRIPMSGPADVSSLKELIDAGHLKAHNIVAILGKTEGNGCVNDFTREYALRAFTDFLAAELKVGAQEVNARIALVMSGGTEGVLSPHVTIFARETVDALPASEKRLSVGVAFTREFLPEEIGRSAQVHETARATNAAMIDASIDDPGDVHFVQIKCPLLTAERIRAAARRGCSTVTEDTYSSMGYSRGASALGVAVALGETKKIITDAVILHDFDLYSSTASASAGIELVRSAVVVMGNSARSVSQSVIGHAVMRDALDLPSVLAAFKAAGLPGGWRSDDRVAGRVINVLAKAEASPDGKVRGWRHTMLDDSDIHSTRHARAAVGGLIAGIVGSGAVYVSGGAEHQGPAGGGPVAVIARTA